MAPPRATKATTFERVGAHVKRHGLTYALAGTALGLGLAGTVAANNFNLMDGVLTGAKTWARPLFRPPMRDEGAQVQSVGPHDFADGYSRGLTEGIFSRYSLPPTTADMGTGVETYNPRRRGVRPILRERAI